MNSELHNQIEPCDSLELESDLAAMIADGVTQKIVRTVKDGHEMIAGIFRCDLDPGQTRYVLNVPIYPALSTVPSVESMVFEDGVRTRITNCEKFGIRVELVISDADHSFKSIFVETVICTDQPTNND